MSQLCEGQTGNPVEDEHGRALPTEFTPCEKHAKFVVRRHFSGVEQQLCGVHSRRFRKDNTGAFTVTELATAAR